MFNFLSCLKSVLSVGIALTVNGVFVISAAQSTPQNDCVAQMKVAVNAINANPKDASAFYKRGLAYGCLTSQEVLTAVGKSRDSVKTKTPTGQDVSAVEILRQLKSEGVLAEKAIVDFSHAIKLNPKYKEAYLARALSYLTKGIGIDMESPEFDQTNKKALADLNRVILLDSNNSQAYKERALIRLHFEEFDLSIADYTKAIMLSPNQYKLYEARGSAYYWKGMESFEKQDFQRSVKDITKAIGLATDPRVLSSLHDQRADSYALMEDKVNEATDRKKAEELEKAKKP